MEIPDLSHADPGDIKKIVSVNQCSEHDVLGSARDLAGGALWSHALASYQQWLHCMPVWLMFELYCHGVQYAVEYCFQSYKCIILIVNVNLNSRWIHYLIK